MAKCKNHNMEMIHTHNYGYTTQCKECHETYTFDSNDKSIVWKVFGGCLVVVIVIEIILAIFDITISWW